MHSVLQLLALPMSVSMVHACWSSQSAIVLHGADVDIGSQVSPGCSMPSPQLAEQSLSFAWVQPPAQQPSPFLQLAIKRTHSALHVAMLLSARGEHEPNAGHSKGQLPGFPASMLMSQVSSPVT
jgi:hypothetical protein